MRPCFAAKYLPDASLTDAVLASNLALTETMSIGMNRLNVREYKIWTP